MSLIFKLKTKPVIVSTHHIFKIDRFNKIILKDTIHKTKQNKKAEIKLVQENKCPKKLNGSNNIDSE